MEYDFDPLSDTQTYCSVMLINVDIKPLYILNTQGLTESRDSAVIFKVELTCASVPVLRKIRCTGDAD